MDELNVIVNSKVNWSKPKKIRTIKSVDHRLDFHKYMEELRKIRTWKGDAVFKKICWPETLWHDGFCWNSQSSLRFVFSQTLSLSLSLSLYFLLLFSLNRDRKSHYQKRTTLNREPSFDFIPPLRRLSNISFSGDPSWTSKTVMDLRGWGR